MTHFLSVLLDAVCPSTSFRSSCWHLPFGKLSNVAGRKAWSPHLWLFPLGHCHHKPKLFWSLILRSYWIILIKTQIFVQLPLIFALSALSNLGDPTGSDRALSLSMEAATLQDSSTLSISSFKFEQDPYTVNINPMQAPSKWKVTWFCQSFGQAIFLAKLPQTYGFSSCKRPSCFTVEGIQN